MKNFLPPPAFQFDACLKETFRLWKKIPAEVILSIKSELMSRNIVVELSDFGHYRTLVLCRIEIM